MTTTTVHVTASKPPFGVNVGVVGLLTHGPDQCADDPACCIHKPSDHKMVSWRMHWRGDRGLMERVCPEHGTGHPDPDDIAYKRSVGQLNAADVHGCCGCCA